MFWELYQHSRINAANQTANRAAGDGTRNATSIKFLEDRIDRLTLVCNAMWSLMSEVTGLDDRQLEERMKDLDLSDGQLDGKVRATVQQCPSCDRPLSAKHARCMYCGAEVEKDPFGSVR